MRSCTNATDPARTATTKGVLRPAQTAAVAGLEREKPVSPALWPFVERYWSVRWDRAGLPEFRSEVLGHPCVNVSVEDGDRPRFGHAMPAVLVHGASTRRFVVDLEGTGRVTAVKFRPGGFVALTGCPPRRDSVDRLRDELGIDPEALLSTVLAEDDDAARAARLDAALLPLATEPAKDYLGLLELLAEMVADRTIVSVEQVAGIGATTTRSLQRLFAAYLGIGPKAVLARYRLHDAVDLLDAGAVDDLATLAVDLGWSDQAHFSRDFRAVVGVPPSVYLRRATAAR